jgi:hypothetical protein
MMVEAASAKLDGYMLDTTEFNAVAKGNPPKTVARPVNTFGARGSLTERPARIGIRFFRVVAILLALLIAARAFILLVSQQ